MTFMRLARYIGGFRVETFDADLRNVAYIAISHVWGSARWQQVSGIASEILVSDHKADFLTNFLPALVGSSPFWMDVVCVDQRDVAARKAVAGAIPDVFRLSVRTLAIRDGDGINECCAEAVGHFAEWEDEGSTLFWEHVQEAHHLGLIESYLDRLWTLQEILLSDVVQFANCPRRPSIPSNRTNDHHIIKLDADRIKDGLHTLGYTWCNYGVGMQDGPWPFDEFIRAYFHSGTVRRFPRATPLEELGFPDNHFYEFFLNSCRTASVAADYILAVFPQFSWYSVPAGHKTMKFQELFLDAYNQAHVSGHGFIARITKSMTDMRNHAHAWDPSIDIPEPSSLGDLLKLMGNAGGRTSFTKAAFTGPVSIYEASTLLDLETSLQVIKNSIDLAQSTWIEAHRGELAKFGSWPVEDPFGKDLYFYFDKYNKKTKGYRRQRPEYFNWYVNSALERLDQEWVVMECRKILDLLACAQQLPRPNRHRDQMVGSWMRYERWLLKNNPPFYTETLLMLAAMVNCLIPLSAYDWAVRLFRVVVVQYPGPEKMRLLGLVGKEHLDYLRPMVSFSRIGKKLPPWVGMEIYGKFRWASGVAYGAERLSQRRWPTGHNLVLVDFQSKRPIGLLPNFLAIAEPNEIFTRRLTQLYFRAQRVDGRDDQVILPFVRIEYVDVDPKDGWFIDGGPPLASRDLISGLPPLDLNFATNSVP